MWCVNIRFFCEGGRIGVKEIERVIGNFYYFFFNRVWGGGGFVLKLIY